MSQGVTRDDIPITVITNMFWGLILELNPSNHKTGSETNTTILIILNAESITPVADRDPTKEIKKALTEYLTEHPQVTTAMLQLGQPRPPKGAISMEYILKMVDVIKQVASEHKTPLLEILLT